MRILLTLAALALVWSPLPLKAQETKKEKNLVELGGLKSKAPDSWIAEETSSRMRLYQFNLPHAKDDKIDGVLIVYFFGPKGSGSVEENIKRWKGMIEPPEGKKIDDVTTVEKIKVGEASVTYLDAVGAYLHRERPIDMKVDKRPGHRLFGIVFEAPKGIYYMRAYGPAKTMTEHKMAFDDWLKAFK